MQPDFCRIDDGIFPHRLDASLPATSLFSSSVHWGGTYYWVKSADEVVGPGNGTQRRITWSEMWFKFNCVKAVP